MDRFSFFTALRFLKPVSNSSLWPPKPRETGTTGEHSGNHAELYRSTKTEHLLTAADKYRLSIEAIQVDGSSVSSLGPAYFSTSRVGRSEESAMSGTAAEGSTRVKDTTTGEAIELDAAMCTFELVVLETTIALKEDGMETPKTSSFRLLTSSAFAKKPETPAKKEYEVYVRLDGRIYQLDGAQVKGMALEGQKRKGASDSANDNDKDDLTLPSCMVLYFDSCLWRIFALKPSHHYHLLHPQDDEFFELEQIAARLEVVFLEEKRVRELIRRARNTIPTKASSPTTAQSSSGRSESPNAQTTSPVSTIAKKQPRDELNGSTSGLLLQQRPSKLARQQEDLDRFRVKIESLRVLLNTPASFAICQVTAQQHWGRLLTETADALVYADRSELQEELERLQNELQECRNEMEQHLLAFFPVMQSKRPFQPGQFLSAASPASTTTCATRSASETMDRVQECLDRHKRILEERNRLFSLPTRDF